MDLSSKEIYTLVILNAFRITGFMKFTCIMIELTNLKFVENISTQNFYFLSFQKHLCHFVLCLVPLVATWFFVLQIKQYSFRYCNLYFFVLFVNLKVNMWLSTKALIKTSHSPRIKLLSEQQWNSQVYEEFVINLQVYLL